MTGSRLAGGLAGDVGSGSRNGRSTGKVTKRDDLALTNQRLIHIPGGVNKAGVQSAPLCDETPCLPYPTAGEQFYEFTVSIQARKGFDNSIVPSDNA